MQTDERFKLLLNATPEQLAAVDMALAGKSEADRPPSLKSYRPGEAAKAVNLSRATLWRLTREGKLAAFEVRKGSHRYAEAELRRFVEGRK